MIQALQDSILIFVAVLGAISAVIGIAGYIEGFVPAPQKQALRLGLTRIAERSVIPPDALLLFERVFGKRLISGRSLLASLCVSILGALIAVGLIYATSDEDSVNVGRDATAFIGEFPVIAAVFCSVYLMFDYISFLITAAFVRMAATSPSKSQAILLFLGDAALSISVCVMGLALASTIAVQVAPSAFWPNASVRLVTGSDTAIQSIATVSAIDFALAPETYRLLVPPSVSPEIGPLVRQGGITSYARSLTTQQSEQLSPLLQVMLGQANIERVVAQINADAIQYKVEEWSCSGGPDLTTALRNELLLTLYGTGERPTCPLPTLFWRRNSESLSDIAINRTDDIFVGMAALYLHDLVFLLQSKFTSYVKVTPQLQWVEVVYDSVASNEAAWIGSNFDLTRAEDQFTMRALELRSSPNAVDVSVSREGPADTSSDSEDDWGPWVPEGSTYYYNVYDVYEAYPSIPISPFFFSALWMSLGFYLFIIYSLFAKFALGAWSVAMFIIKKTNWADKPVQLVGGAVALFLGLLILLVFLAH